MSNNYYETITVPDKDKIILDIIRNALNVARHAGDEPGISPSELNDKILKIVACLVGMRKLGVVDTTKYQKLLVYANDNGRRIHNQEDWSEIRRDLYLCAEILSGADTTELIGKGTESAWKLRVPVMLAQVLGNLQKTQHAHDLISSFN